MKKTFCILFLGVCLLCFVVGAQAEDGRFAFGLKAGTLGPGIEGVVTLTDNFNARVGFNMFEYSYDGETSDVNYDIDLKLQSFSGLLDWFPFDNGFRLSTGVIFNQNEIDAQASSTATYTIGDTTYSLAEVGTLKGNVNFNDAAPYLGIGWGTPFGKSSRWSINFDLGAMYQGSAEVDLSADGTLSSNAAFLADLQREEDSIKDKLDDYKFYPVVAVGVLFRF